MEPDMATAVPLDDAEVIAKLYRRLVLLVGLQILLSLVVQFPQVLGPTMAAGVLALILLALLIGVLVADAVTAYRLMGYLSSSPPILWAIAMFLPCVNIIVLLVISSKAQSWCQRYGIKVGFLGPTRESIEEVRRRTVTSKFE